MSNRSWYSALTPMGRKCLAQERASWTRIARAIALILQRSST